MFGLARRLGSSFAPASKASTGCPATSSFRQQVRRKAGRSVPIGPSTRRRPRRGARPCPEPNGHLPEPRDRRGEVPCGRPEGGRVSRCEAPRRHRLGDGQVHEVSDSRSCGQLNGVRGRSRAEGAPRRSGRFGACDHFGLRQGVRRARVGGGGTRSWLLLREALPFARSTARTSIPTGRRASKWAWGNKCRGSAANHCWKLSESDDAQA